VTLPLTDPRALDIGAGTAERLPGAVRLDASRAVRPHVVADLDEGLPFRDGSFDRVGAYDVVEHVADLVALVAEVHRVLAPGGVFAVTTPHFSSANAYTDPTHRRALGLRSFDYFEAGDPLGFYSSARFRKRRATLFFHGRVAGRAMAALARRWPDLYERRLAWIFPAWFIHFDLEAVK
jgi:SAM-dependent methyltransferase